ncbi:MAG: hypothetical protein L3J20_14030 [Flavobacteriaceae bacterium]|nr:hypothetical protein [Flavobacteriaceae bacterium]
MKTRIIFTILFSILLITFINAQEGWDKTRQNDVLVYIPSDIERGKTFKVSIPKPVKLNGKDLKKWFLEKAKEMQVSLGNPLKKWEIKPDKDAIWGLANMYVNSKGEKLSVGYQGGTLDNGKAFIMQAVMSQDLGIIYKYGTKLKNLKKDAEKTFTDNSSLSGIQNSSVNQQKEANTKRKSNKKITSNKKTKLTGKQKRLAIENAIRTLPNNGVKASETETVWIHSWLNVILGGISVDTYLLLKDGAVYDGLKIPPNELNVKMSKELQTKKWTKWKRSGSGYQVFNKKKGTWEKLEGNKANKTRAGEKLNVKYITASGSQMFGSHRSWITFKPNGRFELENLSIMSSPDGSIGPSLTIVQKSDKTGTSGTTVVIGTNVGGGTSSKKKDGSKNTGTYHLNGYTITLKHDNGYDHTELFFFDESDKKSFIYKDDRFWIPKK